MQTLEYFSSPIDNIQKLFKLYTKYDFHTNFQKDNQNGD